MAKLLAATREQKVRIEAGRNHPRGEVATAAGRKPRRGEFMMGTCARGTVEEPSWVGKEPSNDMAEFLTKISKERTTHPIMGSAGAQQSSS
jgi:hypothetical protein